MKRKKWSHSVGRRPHRVTVFERQPAGVLYVKAWDPTLRSGNGDMRLVSLGHRDKTAAIAHAAELHAKLVKGDEQWRAGSLRLSSLLTLYCSHQSPKKGLTEQAADQRRVKLFTLFLGSDKDPAKITRSEWDRFIEQRRSGRLAADGNTITEDAKQRPVRDRTIEADLRWLLAVLNWATSWQDRNGRYLLRENPARGYTVPREKNPRRPVMTQDRYEALRAVSDQILMEIRERGRREMTRSYLSELLDLANETGRRISAILSLRFEDLDLDRNHNSPHGRISWPAETDKEGRLWTAIPISEGARRAIDRIMSERPGLGAAFLFPSPGDSQKPTHRNLADKWLREAESIAGLEPQIGSLWHAFRRKAATELKNAPDRDVMALLGWSDPRSLKLAYQQADPYTMLTALKDRRELRDAIH